MPTYGRTFDAARQAQGFRSQSHLDSFFAHYDHVKGCKDCHPGAVLLTDGWQGTVQECDVAHELYLASLSAK